MKIPFKPVRLEDKEVITRYTMGSEYQNCDFSFANMCCWQPKYETEFAVVGEFLVIRFLSDNNKEYSYMMPSGNGDLKKIISIMEQDSEENNQPFKLLGVTPDAKNLLETIFPDNFIYNPERDFFDYVYLRSDLATLEGRKYQQKRNHINAFKKQYEYEYLPLTPDLVRECIALENKWFLENFEKTDEDVEEINDERKAMIYALNNLTELGIEGCAIRVDGKIAAFTYGSPINNKTFGVHVEKADKVYQGLYQLINQEFVSNLPDEYIYINREEDLGIEGLRRSKMSYKPVVLLEKNAVVKKPSSKHIYRK